MLQREVAERLAAPPGTKARGILSVLLQAWYDVEYLFTVSENVFNPPPKVLVLVVGYYAFQMLEIVLVKLFHNLEALARREVTARVISLNCSTE